MLVWTTLQYFPVLILIGAKETFANVKTWLGEIERYAVDGVKRVRVSSSLGGLARALMGSIAGAPAMTKPAVKVARVSATAMGRLM